MKQALQMQLPSAPLQDDDNYWSTSEEITISEGSDTNLCSGDNGGCDVDVTLTKIVVTKIPRLSEPLLHTLTLRIEPIGALLKWSKTVAFLGHQCRF